MSQHNKRVLAFVAVFFIGMIFGLIRNTEVEVVEEVEVIREVEVEKEVIKEVEKEVVKKVTPQSCIDVIEIDNKIFTMTADALSFDATAMRRLNNYLEDNTDKRTALIFDCASYR